MDDLLGLRALNRTAFAHLPLSNVVQDTSQTTVGGTGRPGRDRGVLPARRNRALALALPELIPPTTPQSASGWLGGRRRNDVRSPLSSVTSRNLDYNPKG